MPTPVRLVSLAVVLALPLASCGSSRSTVVTPEEQLRFGAEMAQRGLWSEAFFRFQQARQLEGGTDAKVLNNLAVASEALGKFDDALAFYKQAIALAPGEADLKANYDRFVSFYESFRARGEEGKDGKDGKAVPAAPAADSGSGNRRPTAPGPPPVPAPGQPPGLEPPDVPPLIPEPAPTPPSPLSSTAGGASHG
jgi:tetratricopeptide repeat protein